MARYRQKVQTKRNATNKKIHDAIMERENRRLAYKKFYKLKQQYANKCYNVLN